MFKRFMQGLKREMSEAYTTGELLLIDTIDNRPALVWAMHTSENMYPDIVDKIEAGEFVVCIDGIPDASYIKILSPRGTSGYIHTNHISKSK